MAFQLPEYHAPDFTALQNSPDAVTAPAPMDGVAPEGYHSTSMYPEYFKIDGEWRLAEESRMDSSVVLRPDGRLDVVENRKAAPNGERRASISMPTASTPPTARPTTSSSSVRGAAARRPTPATMTA